MTKTDHVTKTYQDYIFKSRYARYLWEEKRRETWEETVERYFVAITHKVKSSHRIYSTFYKDLDEAIGAVLNKEVMPSMRGFMVAGDALIRHEASIYNCAYMEVDDIRAFSETMYLLMLGCGVGYSVESHCISKIPRIPKDLKISNTTYTIKDNKEGWGDAIFTLMHEATRGRIVQFDYSKIRPAGAPLLTMGGRASGPEPLRKTIVSIQNILRNRRGWYLTPKDCSDIMCHIASAVVVGGVRRSSCICLSDLESEEMRRYKNDVKNNPHRHQANVSAVFCKPTLDAGDLFREWGEMIKNNTGERGFFNNHAAMLKTNSVGREPVRWGCNPCGEIILPSKGLCNLSEVIIRPDTSISEIKRRVKIAAKIGVWQGLFRDFRYLRKEWSENIQKDPIIGVSLTGIADNPKMFRTNNEKVLKKLNRECHEQAADTAFSLNVKPPTAVCTVKPSGTVSKLCNTSPGIHPRINPKRKFIGNVRGDLKDPIVKFLIDQGVPSEPLATSPDTTVVLKFPLGTPKKAKTISDVSAKEQMEIALNYQKHWSDHNVSCTVHLDGAEEWKQAFDHVQKNWDDIVGITFFPRYDAVYAQPPYEDVTEEMWYHFYNKFPKEIDWSKLAKFEDTDQTMGSQHRECSGGSCHLTIS